MWGLPTCLLLQHVSRVIEWNLCLLKQQSPPTNKHDKHIGFASTSWSKMCPLDVFFPETGRLAVKFQNGNGKKYFVFTAVRDPYDRMVSAYRYCNRIPATSPHNVIDKDKIPWKDFCEDPAASGGCYTPNNAKYPYKRNQAHVENLHYEFPLLWAFHGWWG